MAPSQVSPYLGDEPSTGLAALAVGSTFLLLLQDTLPACAVLQGELPQQFADGCHLHVPCRAHRVPQVQHKGVKPMGTSVTVGHQTDCEVPAVSPSHQPVEDTPVHHLQDNDALGAVLEELCQLGLQHRLGLMLGNHLQVVPGGPAPPLQLHQAVGQLFKVNLEE